ncbi:MAG: aldo/keto reductase [Candidatus Wallbacteria bacterium]
MLYKKFGKTGVNLSILGFGCMRLPIINGNPGMIDIEKAEEMLKYAIDNGVNYIDTAYPYHSEKFMQKGMSEVFVGNFLSKGYRNKVHLATKLPSWLINSREDMDKYLNEQLERLKTDHIDFYLVHALKTDFWNKLQSLGICQFLDSAIADGRIKYAGFSFHDELGLFKKIVDSYNWSFCQIQYNYMDENYQAGLEGLRYAHERGLGVVIMEPLKGGMLTNKLPDEINSVLNKNGVKRQAADIALRYLWSRQEIGLVLSGMSAMQHVVDNVESASKAAEGSFSKNDIEIISEIRNIFKTRLKVECTACQYCMPCPNGVNIPGVFQLYNTAFIYNNIEGIKMQYNGFLPPECHASKCVKCGKCETACLQKIKIIKTLEEVVKTFGS